MKVKFTLRELEVLNQHLDHGEARQESQTRQELKNKLPLMIQSRRERKAAKAAAKAGA